jgi:hypothetical protein
VARNTSGLHYWALYSISGSLCILLSQRVYSLTGVPRAIRSSNYMVTPSIVVYYRNFESSHL